MQISTWFLAEHARVHSAAIGPLHDWHVAPGFSIQREEDTICDGLSDAQLRQMPGGLNSIAWLLWHLARCEDVGVNLMLRGRSEVLDDEQWLPRLQVETRHIGTGASEDEVRQFSACVDVGMLRAYRAALGRGPVSGELLAARVQSCHRLDHGTGGLAIWAGARRGATIYRHPAWGRRSPPRCARCQRPGG